MSSVIDITDMITEKSLYRSIAALTLKVSRLWEMHTCSTSDKSLVVFRDRGTCNLLRYDASIAQMKAEIPKFTSLIHLFTPIQILSEHEMWIDEVR